MNGTGGCQIWVYESPRLWPQNQFGVGHDPIKYFSVIYAMLEIELENENGQMTWNSRLELFRVN